MKSAGIQGLGNLILVCFPHHTEKYSKNMHWKQARPLQKIRHTLMGEIYMAGKVYVLVIFSDGHIV